jgi:AhpD family alkylhydroperoxidase
VYLFFLTSVYTVTKQINHMKEKEILDQREKHIVFIGASIGSGCRPCTKYHVTKSLEDGFTDDEIHKILSLAISVRDMATRNMKSFAMNKFPEAESGLEIQESLNRNDILVGLAASYCINFHPGFSKYKSFAQKNGINDEELSEILKISGAVSDKARSLLI